MAPSQSIMRLLLASWVMMAWALNSAAWTLYHPKPGGIGQFSVSIALAQCGDRYGRPLLQASNEPIEYNHNDADYRDACFLTVAGSWSLPKDWVIVDESSNLRSVVNGGYDTYRPDKMIPGLPDIKMLDTEALSGLLEDNLSPPEITSILVFATNGAIFAYASSLPARQLRNLSATYGAAYTSYAKNASSGNLTGVNPSSHPSSYVTQQSTSLGDVGSIVFELDDSVAVVTRIADKLLLATVGPSKLGRTANGITGAPSENTQLPSNEQLHVPEEEESRTPTEPATNGSATPHSESNSNEAPAQSTQDDLDAALDTQYQIDRSADLSRLAGLNLSTSPSILLALESKSAALGRFLSQKLADLKSPEDF